MGLAERIHSVVECREVNFSSTASARQRAWLAASMGLPCVSDPSFPRPTPLHGLRHERRARHPKIHEDVGEPPPSVAATVA
jgi:hypothetical protein